MFYVYKSTNTDASVFEANLEYARRNMQAVAAQQAQLLASLNASGKLSEQVLKISLVY